MATVCIQGLGFVGAAMCVAAAGARDASGKPLHDVVGVELDTPPGRDRAGRVNQGTFPFPTSDAALVDGMRRAFEARCLSATTDPAAFAEADVIVVDIGLDIDRGQTPPKLKMDAFTRAIETVAAHMRPGALVVVETTVPPGTCARVVAPALAAGLVARGLPADAFLLAHAYERVMPGRDYLASIVDFWRCYAGHTPEAADACEGFLSSFINTAEYPLRRLSSTLASETAKVLENTYRATTIALMEEWGRFAEAVGVDLFEVIDAIRVRPTHSNIRQPGFGVGGYCLTKDPLFAQAAARELFGLEVDFPFSTMAVEVNQAMPLVSVAKVEELLGGLTGRRILLLGISYRQDIADTRHSPSEAFVRAVRTKGGTVVAHDPLTSRWEEMEMDVDPAVPAPDGFDAVVFAVPHPAYVGMDVLEWLGSARPLVFDANAVLGREQLDRLRRAGLRVGAIGRGEEGR